MICAACLEARAEATYLSCSGTLRMIHAGIASPEEPWTFAVTVDPEGKTITVDDYEPVPFSGDTAKNIIAFMPSQPGLGVGTGTLHRVTGEASIVIVKEDGLAMLNGICKPSRKLF